MQYEYDLNTFCKQDQKDLVCYLQRQLLARDQRIAELSYDVERLRNVSLTNSITDKQIIANTKTVPVQLLRRNNPDLVNSTVSEKNFFSNAILGLSCLVMSSFYSRIDDESLNVLPLTRRHFFLSPFWLFLSGFFSSSPSCIYKSISTSNRI